MRKLIAASALAACCLAFLPSGGPAHAAGAASNPPFCTGLVTIDTKLGADSSLSPADAQADQVVDQLLTTYTCSDPDND